MCVAKTKTQISCAVTAQLICVFVFANADIVGFLIQLSLQFNTVSNDIAKST